MLSGSIIPLMQLFQSCLFLGMLIFLVARLIQGLLANPSWRHIHPSDKTLMQLHGPVIQQSFSAWLSFRCC